jgi:adenylosuccinate synthase
MPATIVIGAQWGDEGKVVDWAAKEVDLVARYGGGDNAGRTVTHLARIHCGGRRI